MRQTVQRFFALALAVAMLFGTVGAVAAQDTEPNDPVPGNDSFDVTLKARFQYSIDLTVTGQVINFGTVDSQGDETYNANVLACDPRTFGPGQFYANTEYTTVTIESDGPYRVSATSTASDFFLVDRHDQLYTDFCNEPDYGSVDENLNNDTPVYQPDTLTTGPRDEFFYWGLQVGPGAGQINNGDVTITYTAEQMPAP